MLTLDPNNPPLCPSCGKDIFRPGRMVTAFDNRASKDDITVTICRHCCEPFELSKGADGVIGLAHIPEGKRAHLEPVYTEAVVGYRARQREAKELGLSLDDYMALLDRMPKTKPKRSEIN